MSKIVGYIMDIHGDPIADAQVLSTHYSTFTNEDGYFELDTADTSGSVHVLYPDFLPFEFSLDDNDVSIILEQDPDADLSTVEITAQRSKKSSWGWWLLFGVAIAAAKSRS